MELEQSLEKFRQEGLGVAAISYDRVEALEHFATRMGGISYPLLSNPDSSIIRAFGIFNHNIPEDHPWYGICFPGTFIVDENGVVQKKFFEQMHRQRFTADTILVKEFGQGGGKRLEAKTDHLTVTASASQDTVRPGNRFTLVFELELPPKMHVYAPEVKGYRPISLTVDEAPHLQIHTTEFPEAKMLHLEAIKETVPVYEEHARIYQDVTISPRYREETLEINATLSYQACDDRICYAPATVPLTFTVNMTPHDRERVPEDMRPKGKTQ